MGKIWTKEFADRYSNLSNFNRTKFKTSVKGVTFRKTEVSYVRDDDLVVIIPEVGNQHDEYACMVMHDGTGKQIGYLAKEINKNIWKNIKEKGHLYIGRVTITGQDRDSKGLLIDMIHLEPKTAETSDAGTK